MPLGKNIRDLRIEQNKTLKEIAELAKISLSYLSDIENERKNPSIKTLEKIAKALGTTSSDLIGAPNDYVEKYKITKKDILQRDEVLKHAQAFMMDDKVDENDKEKLFEIVNRLYWKAKSNNKEKRNKDN